MSCSRNSPGSGIGSLLQVILAVIALVSVVPAPGPAEPLAAGGVQRPAAAPDIRDTTTASVAFTGNTAADTDV